jgi:hypothetical protein
VLVLLTGCWSGSIGTVQQDVGGRDQKEGGCMRMPVAC